MRTIKQLTEQELHEFEKDMNGAILNIDATPYIELTSNYIDVADIADIVKWLNDKNIDIL